MSPRWIDALVRRRRTHLRAYLGTQRVTVDLLTGWRSPRVAHSVVLPIAGRGLEAALTALAEALRALRASHGSLRDLRCDVVLADGWIVYDVVAIDVLRVSAAAAGSAVAAALADVCGTRPDALEVRWQWQADGRSIFAMAMPRGVLAKLQSLFASGGLVAGSVTGEFIAVYNRQRAGLKGRRVVLAVGREGAAQIAVLVDGVIRATRFELGGSDTSLAGAAAGVLRERGDDTTTPTDYVLDADDETGAGAAALDARWSRVRSPAWTGSRASAPAQ